MNDFDDRRSPGGLGARVAVYARLVRVPNLFTAPPDVMVGLALAVGLGATIAIETAVGLAVASAMLYAAGTTLNDYADADEDARHRPERPIPSGEVSRRAALALGVVLLGGGVLLATVAAGPTAGAVAATLAAAIVLYDGAFKGSIVGFLFMGASRSLNVLLGLAAAVAPWAVPVETLVVPLVVGAYVAAITYMAESESGGAATLAVPVAIAGAAVATVGCLLALVLRAPTTVEFAVGVALLLVFAGWIGRALGRAYRDPTPETIGPAVGTCVLGLVVLDAAFVAPAGTFWSVATAAFLGPAVGLAKAFDVS